MGKRSHEDNQFLANFDRPIAFHPAFVPIAGSITAALMLSQMVYWTKRLGEEADGWFYKSQADWTEETGMSRYEQESARLKLRDRGFLEETRKGMKDGFLWFRLNLKALRRGLGLRESSNAGIQQRGNPAKGKSIIRNGGIPQTITNKEETTQRLLKNPLPPNPLFADAKKGKEGDVNSAAHDHKPDALAFFASRIGITSRRVLKQLQAPLCLWMREQDTTAYAAATEMGDRWTRYLNDPKRIGKPMSMTTFFTQGYWLNPESWLVPTIANTNKSRPGPDMSVGRYDPNSPPIEYTADQIEFMKNHCHTPEEERFVKSLVPSDAKPRRVQ
jgi:hypothetical protein